MLLTILEDTERAELVNLLHGAIARHGRDTAMGKLWSGMVVKIDGPGKILSIERRYGTVRKRSRRQASISIES